ncbi:MAG: O-antigen ligase family protein, partial [Chloroflexota bacterium]|nr:O-antigen ligase family protein [Chloroflexota bacterium]
MQTKLSVFAAKVAESGWLAALLVVPILFNLYTERIFEEDKIPLMRSIALLVFVALLIWAIERGRDALQIDGRPFWKIPIVLPALVLTGAYLLSTLLSVVPRISFWGAYIRRQGTYTWLAYIAIFFAILLLVRERKQVERVVTLVLLSSVPASLYAFLQNRGLDPIPWGGDVVQRVSSTAGNPIFISAYLIMVLPLTLMRVIEHFKRLLSIDAEEEKQGYLASSLLAGAYLFLLIIQLITIVYSQSRGPLLGLGVGLVFFGILFFLRYSRRLTLGIAGLAVAGIAFLAVFNLPNSPLEPLRNVKYVGRLGQVFQTESGTGLVRTLIWEGATDLLADNPTRALIGYGPEAMYVAYNPYYPPELAQVESRNASPDRSHNETFDSLIMTGVLGFVAQTVLFLSIFYYTLRWLGLIDNTRQRYAFFGTVGAGTLLGTFLPFLLEGSFRMSGVGLPVGIGIALITYLLAYAVTHSKPEAEQAHHPYYLLLVALLAAVIGHYMEIHLGIAIGVTRLYFWIYTALIIVIGLPLVRTPAAIETDGDAVESSRSSRRSRRRGRSASRLPILTSTLVGLSLMMSLILAILTFNFYVPNVGLDMGEIAFSLIWLFIGTWLFGALAVSAESAFEQAESERWLQRMGAYVLI